MFRKYGHVFLKTWKCLTASSPFSTAKITAKTTAKITAKITATFTAIRDNMSDSNFQGIAYGKT
jgi:hypothetical protein